MSGNGLNREGFLAARDTIAALKGTVECLQVNLSQERDANEGLNLTIESLRGENGSLQEKTFQLESELDALKQEMKDEKNQKKQETAVPESEVRRELEKKLGFYYKDLKNMDEKNLTAEDSETLYHILTYTFKTLKKVGLQF
jgi:leucine zipper putative tumor suppressor 2